METYHKIQTLFKRDLDGSLTGKKGKMLRDKWTSPELEYLAGNEWEFTEKVDGTNVRIGFTLEDGQLTMEVAGRTDRAIMPKPLMLWLETHFFHENGESREFLYDWMKANELTTVVLHGEGYGTDIQNGGNYGPNQEFVLFDVKVGEFWLTGDRVSQVAKALSLDRAPVLGTGTLNDAIEIVSTGLTWDENGRLKRWGGPGIRWGGPGIKGLQSQWGDFEAEGIVARPAVPMFDRMGRRIITKIKAVDFK